MTVSHVCSVGHACATAIVMHERETPMLAGRFMRLRRFARFMSRWAAIAKGTGTGFTRHNLANWAAALTYFGVLSLFPAMVVVLSILGVIGSGATTPLLDYVNDVAPGQVHDVAVSVVDSIQANQGASGVALVVGLVLALWTASGYVNAFMPASNVIWGVEESRRLWHKLALRMGVTLVVLVLMSVTAMAVVLSGPVAESVGDRIGLGSQAVAVWDIAKWPVLAFLVSLTMGILYWAGPSLPVRRFRIVTVGSVVAVVVWVIASLGFTVYVSGFSSYNKTYGTFAGIIVFLVWLWITNIAVLLGAELNAVSARHRPAAEEGGTPSAVDAAADEAATLVA